LFALRKTVEEVQTGVGVARTHALPLSVRGGGYGWAWISDLSSVVASIALRGGYLNFLTSNDGEQLGSAYGSNAAGSATSSDAMIPTRYAHRRYIADGSIMPRVTTGNTMAPCIIIGERAGKILRADHKL
jgi:hypothetical protein